MRWHSRRVEKVAQEAENYFLTKKGFGAVMSYFMSPQTQLGLLPPGQGGAASPSPGSSLRLYSPAEPAVMASGRLGLLSQRAEQVTPAAQAWGPALAGSSEARCCPGGTGWETLARKEYSHARYCHKFPPLRQPESLGWEDGSSRTPQLRGPSRPRPLLLCGLSPGVLPAPSEAVGKEAGSQPDICILTLAMMIAGIPTVPVPGLREEDLIRAAQAFMMAHPEPEGAVEGRGRSRCVSNQPLARCP